MSLRLIDCSLVLTISRLAAVHMSHERISTHRSLHSAIWQLNGQSVSLIVTFSLPCESWQLNGLSVSLIVTFSLSSESWQLNGQSVSLIVTFSLPSESWQLNGLSVSLIVTFSLSSESWQLNGQSVSLIVTFSLSSESWQLNGQSVSLIVTFSLSSESWQLNGQSVSTGDQKVAASIPFQGSETFFLSLRLSLSSKQFTLFNMLQFTLDQQKLSFSLFIVSREKTSLSGSFEDTFLNENAKEKRS